jgi:dienelactone hydrolase
MVQFPSNGHTTDGYLAAPAGGKGPGVLVIQEWWGLVPHIKSVCDRFAAAGFSALAPDMYHGKTASEPDGAGKLFMALNIEQAEKDLRGAATYLAGHSSTAKLGAVGFCMGGQLALFDCHVRSKLADFPAFHVGMMRPMTRDEDNVPDPDTTAAVWAGKFARRRQCQPHGLQLVLDSAHLMALSVGKIAGVERSFCVCYNPAKRSLQPCAHIRAEASR